ncbi:DUF3592 domain-containing protein [Tessaracoccus caeni]|uniref:DUF3592 domain-containing protein n=1 Tax=Tessaracoccus caeni TaxID=3031239 RepID=UPI0023DC9489|nr:DUF3592 domain-containing protein [Tessaracoccus caeni]MDF1488584.1 hypothetical protein [Tessaracoccus caeni]
MAHLLEMHPATIIGMIVVFVVAGTLVLFLVVGVSQAGKPFEQEKDLAASLADKGDRAEARVVAWRRVSGGSEDENALKLTLAIDAEAMRWEIVVPVRVEKELVSRFSPGHIVHVLYDPTDPSLVAVDRERSPVSIPRQGR